MGARQTPRPLSVSDYCRRARRLRHVLRYQPDLLHRSLRQLSDQHDSRRGQTIEAATEHPPLAAIPVSVWRSPAQCEAFSRHVAAMLDGPILRHSSRQVLLREAARRGIGQFEANLVIAAVQHRAKQTPLAPLPPSCAQQSRRWLPAAALVLFATVQSAIVLAVWHLFLS